MIFKPDEDISERVIFPVTEVPVERHRGRAFRGVQRRRTQDLLCDLHGLQRPGDPLRIDRDSDFVSFRMSPLTGAATQNKGMALFPRKIGGKYAMIVGRITRTSI